MAQPRLLLIVGGGIAAYKACELVRLAKRAGVSVTCVLTEGGAQFVTPMSLAALSGNPVYTSLWDLKDEAEMGHIQLSRDADLVVVCPATADLLARMAAGLANDLAATLLLATDKPVLAVPAMNVRMWQHPATQRNAGWLTENGVTVMEPDEGAMACGEYGPGRLPEPERIWATIAAMLGLAGGRGHDEAAQRLTGQAHIAPAQIAQAQTLLDDQPDFTGQPAHRPLYGRHILITAGPTHEPIDPVRYIANRSSGKQGFALAAAAAEAGARVTLVAGPVVLPTPPGVERIDVETACEMAAAVAAALPADVAVMVAAVADWRSRAVAGRKIKKTGDQPASLELEENPDILASLGQGVSRPRLVVGFAAETNDVIANAQAKRLRKGADWIVANDVSFGPDGSVMGGDTNAVHIVTADGVESWASQTKDGVARQLVARIAEELQK